MRPGYVTAILIGCLSAVACVCGCEPVQPASPAALQAEDPDVRLAAIRRAAETKDQAALPFLVDRLTDTETEVRLFAIVALRKITGRDFGYRHFDPPRERAKAVAAWRKWLAERPAEASGPSAATDPPEHR